MRPTKLITCLFFVWLASRSLSTRVLYLEDDVCIVDPPRFDFQSRSLPDTYPWHILRLGSTFHFAVAVERECASPAAESSPSPTTVRSSARKLRVSAMGHARSEGANESMPSAFARPSGPLNYTQAHVGGKYEVH